MSHLTPALDGDTEEPFHPEQPLLRPPLFLLSQGPLRVCPTTACASNRGLRVIPPLQCTCFSCLIRQWSNLQLRLELKVWSLAHTPRSWQSCHLTVVSQLHTRCTSTESRRRGITEARHIPSLTQAHCSLRLKPVKASPAAPLQWGTCYHQRLPTVSPS